MHYCVRTCVRVRVCVCVCACKRVCLLLLTVMLAESECVFDLFQISLFITSV